MPKTPIDYSKSVIYKIEHMDKPELVYVGSTTDFTKRKYQHKYTCNNSNHKQYNYKIYQLIRAHGNWESFKIMIICKFPCNSKIELVIQEEKYRKELQAPLNSCSAYNTIEDVLNKRKEYREANKEKYKEYREINKEQIKEQKKNYYIINSDKKKEYYENNKENNKETRHEQQKQYREANKEKIKEKKIDYYENNKEKILARKKEKVTCICGSIFRIGDKSAHEKTTKHCQFIQQN